MAKEGSAKKVSQNHHYPVRETQSWNKLTLDPLAKIGRPPPRSSIPGKNVVIISLDCCLPIAKLVYSISGSQATIDAYRLLYNKHYIVILTLKALMVL